jgi:uncharacterized protein YbjQ (UPF0145 family)
VLISTTTTLDGLRITHYLGVVSGEAILGANVFKDFFAGVRDIVGGRSQAYEQQLREAKQIAFNEMTHWAASLGANGVVGVDLDYETIGTAVYFVQEGAAAPVGPAPAPAPAPGP